MSIQEFLNLSSPNILIFSNELIDCERIKAVMTLYFDNKPQDLDLKEYFDF